MINEEVEYPDKRIFQQQRLGSSSAPDESILKERNMRTISKFFIFTLALLMSVSLVACGPKAAGPVVLLTQRSALQAHTPPAAQSKRQPARQPASAMEVDEGCHLLGRGSGAIGETESR